MRELAWFLLRLNKNNVLKADDTCGEQSASGWSTFNAEMHVSSTILSCTVIGYSLRTAGLPTDYSTIYTVLKIVQEMSKHIQQSTAVITFDLAAKKSTGVIQKSSKTW